jgi:nucleoside 2-deoxyribosyltransferase
MSELTVTISGSYRKHFDRLMEAKRAFEEMGVKVLRPHSEKIISDEREELVRLEGDPKEASAVQEAQLKAIHDSNFVYVVNPGGYVGNAATLEVGYAHRAQTPVVTSEIPFEPAVAAVAALVGSPQEAVRRIQGQVNE